MAQLTKADFHWLVGLMEGEGSFSVHSKSFSPRVDCGSTDLDVMERVSDLLESKILGPYKTANGKKPYYRIFLHGVRAVEVMNDLKPYLSKRRQGQIDKAIAAYESVPHTRSRNSKGQFEAFPSQGGHQ